MLKISIVKNYLKHFSDFFHKYICEFNYYYYSFNYSIAKFCSSLKMYFCICIFSEMKSFQIYYYFFSLFVKVCSKEFREILTSQKIFSSCKNFSASYIFKQKSIYFFILQKFMLVCVLLEA